MPPRGGKGTAKAPLPSSPLSSAPSPSLPSSHPSPTGSSSPPSPPESPELPKRRARTAAPAKAGSAAASRKAASKSRGKAAAAEARTEAEAPSPRASLDDLLGNMAQDHADRGKRDNKRRKTLDFRPRMPKTDDDDQEVKAKSTKRKREQPDAQSLPEAPGSTVSIPSSPSSRKRRQTILSGKAEDGQSLGSTPVSTIRPSPSPLRKSPEVGPSSLAAQSSLAGRSALADCLLVDTDDEDDLDIALNRLRADKRKAELQKAADFSDFDDVSDPPSPSQSPPPHVPAARRRTTLHRDVEVGCTCLVKYGHNVWFPAKLLAFELATDGGKDYYKVETQDGQQSELHVIEEDQGKRSGRRGKLLWLHERDAVAKVKIGGYQTTIVRSRTDAPPENATEHEIFNSLERDEQVRRCHDHLANLTTEAYPPAQWRIDLFFGTVAERQSLLQKVEDGDLSLDDSKMLAANVSTWIQSGVTGTERFHKLSESERSRYASYVLLPEVIIRICMRSMDLNLPESWTGKPPPVVLAGKAGQDDGNAPVVDAEEQRMYDLACQKLKELRRDSSGNEWERRSLEVTFARNQGLSDLGLDKAAGSQPRSSSRRDRWEDPKLEQRRFEAATRRIQKLEEAKKKRKAKAMAVTALQPSTTTGEAAAESSADLVEEHGPAAGPAAVPVTREPTVGDAVLVQHEAQTVDSKDTPATGIAQDEAAVPPDIARATDSVAETAEGDPPKDMPACEAEAVDDPAIKAGVEESSPAQGEAASTTNTTATANVNGVKTDNGNVATALEQKSSGGTEGQAEAVVNGDRVVEVTSVAETDDPTADDGKVNADELGVDGEEDQANGLAGAVATTAQEPEDTAENKANGVAVSAPMTPQESEIKPLVRRKSGRSTSAHKRD